jgi:hypothetical protein
MTPFVCLRSRFQSGEPEPVSGQQLEGKASADTSFLAQTLEPLPPTTAVSVSSAYSEDDDPVRWSQLTTALAAQHSALLSRRAALRAQWQALCNRPAPPPPPAAATSTSVNAQPLSPAVRIDPRSLLAAQKMSAATPPKAGTDRTRRRPRRRGLHLLHSQPAPVATSRGLSSTAPATAIAAGSVTAPPPPPSAVAMIASFEQTARARLQSLLATPADLEAERQLREAEEQAKSDQAVQLLERMVQAMNPDHVMQTGDAVHSNDELYQAQPHMQLDTQTAAASAGASGEEEAVWYDPERGGYLSPSHLTQSQRQPTYSSVSPAVTAADDATPAFQADSQVEL